jgi:hypothetical protein
METDKRDLSARRSNICTTIDLTDEELLEKEEIKVTEQCEESIVNISCKQQKKKYSFPKEFIGNDKDIVSRMI